MLNSLKSYLYLISNMKIFFVVPFNCVIVAQWHYRYRSYCLLYSSPLYCFFNSRGCMYKMQDGGLTLCSGGHTKSSQQIFPQRWRIQDGGLTSWSVLEDIRNPLIKYSHWDGETKMAALPRVLEDIGTKFGNSLIKYSHWDGEFKMAAIPRVLFWRTYEILPPNIPIEMANSRWRPYLVFLPAGWQLLGLALPSLHRHSVEITPLRILLHRTEPYRM